MPATDSDNNDMVEKIISEIYLIFNKDKDLKEYDIIPVSMNESNRSPLIHKYHILGIESWCLKHVYSFAYSALLEMCNNQKCKPGNSHRHRPNCNNSERLQSLLMSALLINPDVAKFWNQRRQLYDEELLDFSEEMRFTKIVLSRKAKNNEAFAYRKWLLSKYIPGKDFFTRFLAMNEEFWLTQACAEKSPSNYHAWTHRIWMLNFITQTSSPRERSVIYLNEHAYSEQWISSHISDYSGFHYRQFTMTCLLNMKDHSVYQESYTVMREFLESNVKDFNGNLVSADKSHKEIVNCVLGAILENCTENYHEKYTYFYYGINYCLYELILNENLLRTYVCHEALWCHRRFVMQTLVDMIFEYFGETKVRCVSIKEAFTSQASGKSSINVVNQIDERQMLDEEMDDCSREAKILRSDDHSVYNSLLYKAVLLKEISVIDQRSKSGDGFAAKHKKWLKCVLDFFV